MRFRTAGTDDAAPQLSFEIVNNADGTLTPGVIFITDDPGYNKVGLQISLTSGSAQLDPGTIPDPQGSPPASGATFYFDLTQLNLSADCWQKMTFACDGWTFQTFPSEQIFGMTPKDKPVVLASGTAGTITVDVGGIVVPKPLAKPQIQLYAEYYNVPGVTGNYGAFPVALQNVPDGGKDLSEALTVRLTEPAGIVNSVPPLRMAKNLFTLEFVGNQKVKVVADENTMFTVSFVYGVAQDKYGFGALTDITSAQLIAWQLGENTSGWIVTRNSDAQSVYWTIQPPTGAPIVGSGAQSIAGIKFSNIQTTYQPGPTLMLVSYTSVPGYQDGTFVLVLDKVAHAVVNSLSVSPNPAYFSNKSADVTVSWQAGGAQLLELTQNYQTTTVTGQSQAPATLYAESTNFSLKATGAIGSVPNIDYASTTAIALPVINSFTGAPTEIYSGSLSHDATFSWAVDSSDGITLSATQGAFSGQQFGAQDSTSASIEQPQMITMAPTTAANPLTLTRRLVISAFTPNKTSFAQSFTPSAVAASPSGPFVVLAGPSGSLTVVETVRYSVTGTTAIGHPATSLAFSPDGTELATVNSDNSVCVIGLNFDPATGMPVFGAATTVKLQGKPQSLIFSPDASRIFVTVDPGGDAGQVVSLSSLSGKFRQEGSVTVGPAPRGLALDASGSRLFVVNSGDDTASVVGLTSKGALGGVVDMVHGLTGGPTGVVVTPSGKQVLVTCATAGKVIAFDPNHPDTGQRRTLSVGKSPGAVAVTPTGAYAFVANSGDGTVSLVGCWGQPSSAEVLGTPIPVGASPTSVSVSPDGLQVLVAASNSFSLITLATYHAPSVSPPVPNRPTNLAATPDGSAIYAWHDGAIPSNPAPGILIYSTASGLVSNALANLKIMGCVVSPDPAGKQAFAVVDGNVSLQTIDTGTFETGAISLGLTSASLLALAIDGEGATIFVIAADKQRNLSCVIVKSGANGWSVAQTLPLYQKAQPGRVLLRSAPDATSVFLVDVAAAQVRVLTQSGNGSYALSPTIIRGDVSALDLAVLPDSSTAYVLNAGSNTNTITVVDVATLNSRIASVPQTFVNLTGLATSPDGRRLFASDTNAAAVRVLDPNSLRILQTIPLTGQGVTAAGVMGIAVLADGSKVVTANTESQNISIVEQIQMGTGAALRRFGTATPQALPISQLFIRHYLGEQPGSPSNGWSTSPDVIPQNGIVKDVNTLIANPTAPVPAPAGYNHDYGNDIYLSNQNYIYMRGLNTTSAPLTSRAFFYYTKGSLALWPANWSCENVTYNTNPQNWVDITSPANAPGVGQIPLIWTADKIDPASDHYCLISWVVDGQNPPPPDLPNWAKFAVFDDLVNFVVSHHNMAWRNTNDIPSVVPGASYQAPIQMMGGGGTVYLSVNWVNIPLDAKFAINMQGPDSGTSINVADTINNYQGGFTPRNNPFTLPPNYSTSLQIQLWPTKTPFPSITKLKVTLYVQTAPSLTRDIERIYRPLGLRTPLVRVGGINLFPLGMMDFNIHNPNAGGAR